ncbi:MAG: hypothetical protein ACRC1I_07415, partial [Pseudomonas proteolytica]|uniref:hypothetical protein n=1 Tax=Pseudomonas proteolytica TaxID=219574 RepID=UPI003F2AA849
ALSSSALAKVGRHSSMDSARTRETNFFDLPFFIFLMTLHFFGRTGVRAVTFSGDKYSALRNL